MFLEPIPRDEVSKESQRKSNWPGYPFSPVYGVLESKELPGQLDLCRG